MALFGAGAVPGVLERITDDPSWLFYNVYVGEPVEEMPFIWETRREANAAAAGVYLMHGAKRLGLVIIKPPEAPDA